MTKVIRFTASWCGPCKVYAPVFEEVKNETANVDFETIDVDTGNPLISEHGIRNVPTTLIIRQDGSTKKQSGNISKKELLEFIKN